MTRVFDARKGCSFSGRKILFDTNIWIAIDGNDPRDHHAAYSDYFGEVLSSDNQLVTNDYVISEYFNRSCKIQYDIQYRGDPDAGKNYKSRRKSGHLLQYMTDVRDICEDILRDCQFENAITASCPVLSHVSEAKDGLLDFSDIVIREHCLRHGHVIVTDDADYINCGLDLVTANPTFLRMAKVQGKLAS
ncbi:PIN domain-containing protein [Agrobacterium tumefaciens]|uniref:PIN domain-containing protein n=1 Tax=Agrobacterium tumefaciens TaxID=358 RepID=UPI0008100488|nr:PIN domain-containing protein [Agrobacterium tumefaciens]NSL22849.1 PIN domain-containing protein [Agrobacterium tumefaciens]NTC56764.1 PIN domain-containing protein [Agrobacterium tumefaciens]NTC62582.1 PIN domain-containing protein [Agrobacterium tumefaciens]NTC66312.1 PIN domain-containing protein [Agrobacterium tumefaciens]NTC74892.1 PIN domain-containing protein [Agrobacterium tumefaciens]